MIHAFLFIAAVFLTSLILDFISSIFNLSEFHFISITSEILGTLSFIMIILYILIGIFLLINLIPI